MDKEKKMERMLPRIKQTVDAVYEYLIPHPDGCGSCSADQDPGTQDTQSDRERTSAHPP